MSTTRRFTNDSADNGKEQRLRVRAEAGHRCIRCGHPFESGKHGRGEWSPCDEKCTHRGPLHSRQSITGDWTHYETTGLRAGELVMRGIEVQAQWRVLTVHHLDGDKANDAWWNTLALCQRCHLQIQTTVDPRIPYFLEHSDWFKPYVAGFYAHKYEGKMITREEAMERLDELLSYELATAP
jgi:hypothetical protein